MVRNRYLSVAGFVALAAVVYAVYFFRADHFFQGDTIFWFYYRLHSVPDFLRSFASADPGGWYRPLTNRTIESILFPFFGFHPGGYRAVLYFLFLADIFAVWLLASALTKKRVAAAIAAVFFAFHTVNAYTTYDLSFAPELVYTLFYIASVVTFLRFLDGGPRSLKVLSLVFFLAGLCSKEAAVTLPLALLTLALVEGHSLKKVGRELLPYGVSVAVYLWFTLSHLGVASEALASLRTPPPQLETGGYYFMVGPHILSNAATAWTWALNLPVGLLGQWRDVTRVRSTVLWAFAIIQMVLILYAVWRGNRQAVLAAVAWFWICALPALPLLGHFLPYYLFLPIAGFAVLVGASWNQLFEDFAHGSRLLAYGILIAVFSILGVVCAKSARSEARNNFLLGASSRIAQASVDDFRPLYPKIPQASIIFVNDDAKPDLAFHHAGGALFKLAYADDSLQFRYSSLKESPSGATVTLVFRDGHLQEDAR